MNTLTVELPEQTAVKLATLEQHHGERLRQVLGLVVTSLLEKIEKAPETELHALEAAFTASSTTLKEVDFQTAAAYVLANNHELYRRLA
jgi:hypothetical protein